VVSPAAGRTKLAEKWAAAGLAWLSRVRDQER